MKNCKFSSNFAFYLKNQESGCAFYVDSAKPMTIENTLFLVYFVIYLLISS